MVKENSKLLILIALCFILILGGIRLLTINKSNSSVLKENIKYLKLLEDPTINVDGTSLIGRPFYNFNFANLYGKSYQLASIQSLFKIIIIFNLNDCLLCLNEYRLWSKLYEKHPQDKLMVIAICTSREKQAIVNFIKNKEIKFPVLWDPERKVKNHMKFRKSPLRILLDKKNNILDIEHTQTTIEHQQYIMSMVDSLIMKATD